MDESTSEHVVEVETNEVRHGDTVAESAVNVPVGRVARAVHDPSVRLTETDRLSVWELGRTRVDHVNVVTLSDRPLQQLRTRNVRIDETIMEDRNASAKIVQLNSPLTSTILF